MAKNKIERIEKEMEKTREKITEYQNRLRTLEAQKTEAENLQIVQLVRSVRMTPQELSALLSGGAIPGMTAAPADYDEQDETDHEESTTLPLSCRAACRPCSLGRLFCDRLCADPNRGNRRQRRDL